MNSETLGLIKRELPDVFDSSTGPLTWPSPIAIGRGQLFLPKQKISEIDPEDFEDTCKRLEDVQNTLSRMFQKQHFPGVPSANEEQSGLIKTPDRLAFYLPWHSYQEKDWGIYLLIDGVDMLSHQIIQLVSDNSITYGEAQHAAKCFLYFHELYHNAVEQFSIRIESITSKRCYVEHVRKLHRSDLCLPEGAHEEALATSYALGRVKSEAFPMEKDKKRLRDRTFEALSEVIRDLPPQYSDAYYFRNRKSQHSWEHLFRTTIRDLQDPPLPQLIEQVWNAFGGVLWPSIMIEEPFKYVIHSSDPRLVDKI